MALFITLLFGVLLFGYICKKQKWGSFLYKLIFILFCSLLFPSFIPGHGEIVVVLPNGALFTKMTGVTWGIGLFFVFIYSSFIFVLLAKMKNT
jgi:hypothetical protein